MLSVSYRCSKHKKWTKTVGEFLTIYRGTLKVLQNGKGLDSSKLVYTYKKWKKKHFFRRCAQVRIFHKYASKIWYFVHVLQYNTIGL